jgi:nucleotide-binding universal stress UspA family protein
MPEPLVRCVVVPVASEDDARTTLRALLPSLESSGGRATLLNVIEKAGSAPGTASVQQREEYALEVFDAAREVVGDAPVEIRSEIRYGTNVAETIIDTANDLGATAIVFTPRSGSRWVRLLTGAVALSLLTKSDLPLVTLPDTTES